MEKKNGKKKYRAVRIFGKFLLGLALIIILLLLFIRSPWGQDIIKDKLISSLTEETGTEIDVERLFVTFSGNIFLEGLYLEDQQGDTLVYSQELEASVPLWPILRGNGIAVNSLEWSGLKANIERKDSINGFNFDFLIEALAPADTTTTAPDTTAAGMEFSLGEIDLSDFDVVYNDAVLGIKSHFQVGALHLEMEEMNLEEMIFAASNGSIANTKISYKQIPVPENPDEEKTSSPVFMIDELKLENVAANYESVAAGMVAKLDIADFLLGLPQVNLRDKILEISKLQLHNSDIYIKTAPAEGKEAKPTPVEDEKGFQWPEWSIGVEDISFSGNSITYLLNDAEVEKGVFNPDAIEVRELLLKGKDFYLENKEAGGNLQDLSFTESSGVHLKSFRLNGSVTNRRTHVQDLALNLNENHLEGSMNIEYASLDDLMNNPESSVLQALIPEFHLNLKDLFLFLPSLQENEYIQILSDKPLYGEVKAEGTLASVQIPQMEVNWGQWTTITAHGEIENPAKSENMEFDFPQIKVVSRKGDVQKFIEEEKMNIDLPQSFQLIAAVKGNTEEIEASADLQSSVGDIAVNGTFSSAQALSFNADLEINELSLGSLLNNEQLGELNLTLIASGKGETLNDMNADLMANISSFSFNDYPVQDLGITGEIRDGKGPIEMEYKDENLEMEMQNMVFLDSVSPQVNMNLDIAGANLKALGLTQKDIRAALKLDGSFKGNAASYDINAEIIDGVAVYNKESYLLGDFGLSARVRPDSTAVDVSNQILDLHLRSNSDPASFALALQRHFRSYLSTRKEVDTVINPVNLQLHAEVRQDPIIDEVFLTSLQGMDTLSIDVDFHEKNHNLVAKVDLPFLNYMGNEIDSLSLQVDSNRENLDFSVGFEAVNAGPVAIHETILEGSVVDNRFLLEFSSLYEEEYLMHLQAEVSRQNDTVSLAIDPTEIILNSKQWNIPRTNTISFSENYLAFKDFRLTREGQLLKATDEKPGLETDHIAIAFENFNLSNFLSLLNPEEPIATGDLNGNFTIEEPYGATGLLADIKINDLGVLEVPLGDLTLQAEPINNRDYTFELAIREGNADLDLTGGFQATESGPQWDTELALHEIEMLLLEGFSLGEIKNTEGSFSGNFQLSGTLAEPDYEGFIHFSNAGFTVAKLNAPFNLVDETIELDTTGIYFDDFRIEDRESNSFIVNGEVLTEDFLNPGFDLSFQASDFMLMNSTRQDNDLFFGKAIFDADAELTGTLNVPQLSVEVDVAPETNITYIIPESEIGIEERDGVVLFVNRENPDDILTQTEEESYMVTGIELNALISIIEGAVFNIIIDEETGDNFGVTGSGDFNFNIYANGRTTLSGRYEMSGGHYEMSLYNLVNRRFEIVEGSSITWAGSPFDATLDLTARYRVETSASALMAARTSGMATSDRDRFRQELPFLVYLNIEGELTEPVLDFGLGMPEEEQGAIGGEVYAMVQQINQQEQQLNKQVFSLLVLNRFYPETGSDGGGGGTMALARDNLNSALSDQLNLISNDLLGDSGFALDFGLDTFTDYQGESPQERTQLDITAEKSFLDERLVVRVGSEVDVQGHSQVPGESNALIGNVSIEYLLTEDGQWKLRGFRRNSYENVIEGQVIVSGIALIFTREFNEFRDLWEGLKKNLEEKENQEE